MDTVFYPLQVAKRGPKPGYKQTPEHREKRISQLRGRVVKVEVNYWGAHARAKKHFGVDALCVQCGAHPTDMALRRDAPPDTIRVAKGKDGWQQKWSIALPPDLAYMPLCPRCHVIYDKEGGSWNH
jgi:hypothetical protein